MLSNWNSDLLAIAGFVVGIASGIFFAHYRPTLENDEARRTYIRALRTTQWSDAYYRWLEDALNWLDELIRGPFSLHSFWICFGIAASYSITSMVTGWIAGGPSRLGSIEFTSSPTSTTWGSDWVFPLIKASAVYVFVFAFLVSGFRAIRQNRGSNSGLAWFVVTGILGISSIAALGPIKESLIITFVFALTAIIIWVKRYRARKLPESRNITVSYSLFVCIMISMLSIFFNPNSENISVFYFIAFLPMINGILDWLSLSVSRWLGRLVLARQSPTFSVMIALLDLLLAIIFLVSITWLLAFCVELTGVILRLDLNLGSYIESVFIAPWTHGIWGTFMVLSTLIPTAVHFLIAVTALILGWEHTPWRGWVAAQLESGNPANFLWPAIYLSFGWCVGLCAVAGIFWGLSGTFEVFGKSAIDLIRFVPLHGIELAQSLAL